MKVLVHEYEMVVGEDEVQRLTEVNLNELSFEVNDNTAVRDLFIPLLKEYYPMTEYESDDQLATFGFWVNGDFKKAQTFDLKLMPIINYLGFEESVEIFKMPEIGDVYSPSRKEKFRIEFHSDEQKHNYAHVHVTYGNEKFVINLQTLTKIGNSKVRIKHLNEVLEYIKAHQVELLQKWNDSTNGIKVYASIA